MALQTVLQEIETLQLRLLAVERSLEEIAAEDAAVRRLRQVEGIGLLNATAMVATAGSASRLPSGRQFAARLGITPRDRAVASGAISVASPSAAMSTCERC